MSDQTIAFLGFMAFCAAVIISYFWFLAYTVRVKAEAMDKVLKDILAKK